MVEYKERVCEFCKRKFLSANPSARLCSPECFKMKNIKDVKDRYAKREPDYGVKICVICGAEFKPNSPPQIYCSKPCKAEGARRLAAEPTLKTYYHPRRKRKKSGLDASLAEMRALGFGNNYGRYRVWKDRQKERTGV